MQDHNRHNAWLGQLTRHKTDAVPLFQKTSISEGRMCCLPSSPAACLGDFWQSFPPSFCHFLCRWGLDFCDFVFLCFLLFNSDTFWFVFAISSYVRLCPVPCSLASVRLNFPSSPFCACFPHLRLFTYKPPPLPTHPPPRPSSLPSKCPRLSPPPPPPHPLPATTPSQKWRGQVESYE